MQWFGHASRTFWGQDKLWELNDPPKLAPNNVWPFTASYSCWTGYYIWIQPSPQYGNSEQVLAESLLLTPQRGALADFAPTGLHVGDALVNLDKALAEAIFTRRMDRVGLAVDSAKITYYGQSGNPLDVIDTQMLFGDPATRLKLP